MTTNPKIAGYIITHDDSGRINGVGTTQTQAWADFEHSMQLAGVQVVDDPIDTPWGDPEPAVRGEHSCHPASAALLAAARERGATIAWHLIDGIATTLDDAG